jgi:hypothetical protein
VPGLLSAPAAASIVITATCMSLRADQGLAESSVIDRAQIEAATGHALAELMVRQAGVQFWSNGGLGTAASVSLRGTEGRHTLLLIDSVSYSSATLGAPIWDTAAGHRAHRDRARPSVRPARQRRAGRRGAGFLPQRHGRLAPYVSPSGFDAGKLDAAFWAGTQVVTNFVCTLGHGDPSKVLPRHPRLSFEEACRLV